MGLADSLATKLYVNRRLHDVAFKMQSALNRKLAVISKVNYVLGNGLSFTNGSIPDLFELHGIEKELDAKIKHYEVEREALKQELEAMNKITQDRAKNDFKIG